MIAINGKNSLEGLFFDANNSFDSDELRNELIKKTKLEKLNLSFYINIKNDDVMLWLRIKDCRNLYKLNFVDNKFKDNNSNCPKEVIDIINQSKALNYFSHKKEMLKDFFLSQKDYINIVELSLKYTKYDSNIIGEIWKDIYIKSDNKHSYNIDNTSQNNITFYISCKPWNISFEYLNEKELKYVLNSCKTVDKIDIEFETHYKNYSKQKRVKYPYFNGEVKDKILKIVDNNKLDNSMQKD